MSAAKRFYPQSVTHVEPQPSPPPVAGHILVPQRVHEPGHVLLLHVLHPRRRPQVLRLQGVRQPGGLRALRHGPTVIIRPPNVFWPCI